MSFVHDQSGSMALTTIGLLPLLLIVLSGVLELGELRIIAARVRAAADLATLVAVNDQDDAELARSGALRLARDAADAARAYYALNLESSAGVLADPPGTVASSADIVAFASSGAVDPLSGVRYDRPTVRISGQVPVRSGVLGALIGRPVVWIGIFSASAPR